MNAFLLHIHLKTYGNGPAFLAHPVCLAILTRGMWWSQPKPASVECR